MQGHKAHDALATEVSNVSATCRGKWTATLNDRVMDGAAGRSHRGHGGLGLSALGATGLDAAGGSVSVNVTGLKLNAVVGVLENTSVEVEQCETGLTIASVEWQGAASKLLDWLSKEAEKPLADTLQVSECAAVVASAEEPKSLHAPHVVTSLMICVSAALQAIGCLEVRTAGKQLLEQWLADFNTQVVPYLHPTPPIAESVKTGQVEEAAAGSEFPNRGNGAGMINWRHSGWLELAYWALNDYIDLDKVNALTAASHGRAQLIPADGPPCPPSPAISYKLPTANLPSLTSSKTAAEIPICLQLPSSLPPLTLSIENISLAVALKRASLQGLDGMTGWQWLKPTVNNELSTMLSGASLNTTLQLEMLLQLQNSSALSAPPLSLPLTVAASLFQPSLHLRILLDVLQNKTAALNLAEATEIGCLLRTVSRAMLTGLRFDYTNATLALSDGSGIDESTGLLPQITSFCYGVLQLLANVHTADVEAVLSAVLAGPGRDALNGLLADGLTKIQTTPPTAAQGGTGLLSLSCDELPEPLAPAIAPPLAAAVAYIAMPAVGLFVAACVAVYFCLCSRTAKAHSRSESAKQIRRQQHGSSNNNTMYHGGPFMEQRRAHQVR